MALLNLREGKANEALSLAKQGRASHADQPESFWYQRFRLLEAECLTSQRRYDSALEILTPPIPPGPALQYLEARRLLLLGNLKRRSSKHEDEAADLLKRAFQLAERDGDNGLMAEIGFRQGSLYTDRRDYDHAGFALEKASRHVVQVQDLYLQTLIFNNLGHNYQRRFRYDEAVAALESALFTSSGAPQFKDIIHLNLGLCYTRLGYFDKGLSHLNKATALQQDRTNATKMNALGETGNNYYFRGNWKRAAAYYQDAFDLAVELKHDHDASRWAGNLTVVYSHLNNWDEAEAWNDRALELRTQSKRSEAEAYWELGRGMVLTGRGRPHDALATYLTLIETTEKTPSLQWNAHSLAANIYVKLNEWSKAEPHFEAALQIIERNTSIRQGEHEITYFSRLISFYQNYVDALVSQGFQEKALRVADSSRARILSGRQGSEKNLRSTRQGIDFNDAAKHTDKVFLCYWLAPKRSFLWLVSADHTGFYQLPAENKIDDLLDFYTRTIERGHDPIERDNPAGYELYRILIEPIAHALKEDSQVVIVPDRALHNLNFETLTVPSKTPHYWIEDVTISIAPSLDLILNIKEKQNGKYDRSSLLVIGDPESEEVNYPKLRYAEQEIKSIERHFADKNVQVLSGGHAYPAAYESANPANYSLIHFAAHAEANSEQPLDSAVILSKEPETNNFKLYAKDLNSHSLNAELVTISSCSSAGIKAYSGEGLVGFAWAFLQAGARNVIAGLWDVDDTSTSKLMDYLYQGLAEDQGPESALRQAKLNLLNSDGNFRKPYYWAPFQVYIR